MKSKNTFFAVAALCLITVGATAQNKKAGMQKGETFNQEQQVEPQPAPEAPMVAPVPQPETPATPQTPAIEQPQSAPAQPKTKSNPLKPARAVKKSTPVEEVPEGKK